MTGEERRSAALLLGEELALGRLRPEDLEHRAVAAAVRSQQAPSRIGRALQRRALRSGSLSFAQQSVAPMAEARRQLLGDEAAGPPRLLVRVDSFPHPQAEADPGRYGTAAFARIAELLTAHDVPFLLATIPHVPREDGWRHLDSGELALLEALRAGGLATFGLNGLDHLPRDAGAERPSELAGLTRTELRERLDRGGAALAQHDIDTPVFVAPWDRFDRTQYAVLAERFDVVCGGDRSVEAMGWHAAPLWRGDAVYLPASGPLDGPAAGAVAEVERLAAAQPALWVPLTLRWGDEPLDDVAALCAALTGLARPWPEFLAAAAASAVWAT